MSLLDPTSKPHLSTDPVETDGLKNIICRLEELGAGDFRAAECVIESLKSDIEQCLKAIPTPGEKSKSG